MLVRVLVLVAMAVGLEAGGQLTDGYSRVQYTRKQAKVKRVGFRRQKLYSL